MSRQIVVGPNTFNNYLAPIMDNILFGEIRTLIHGHSVLTYRDDSFSNQPLFSQKIHSVMVHDDLLFNSYLTGGCELRDHANDVLVYIRVRSTGRERSLDRAFGKNYFLPAFDSLVTKNPWGLCDGFRGDIRCTLREIFQANPITLGDHVSKACHEALAQHRRV